MLYLSRGVTDSRHRDAAHSQLAQDNGAGVIAEGAMVMAMAMGMAMAMAMTKGRG